MEDLHPVLIAFVAGSAIRAFSKNGQGICVHVRRFLLTMTLKRMYTMVGRQKTIG